MNKIVLKPNAQYSDQFAMYSDLVPVADAVNELEDAVATPSDVIIDLPYSSSTNVTSEVLNAEVIDGYLEQGISPIIKEHTSQSNEDACVYYALSDVGKSVGHTYNTHTFVCMGVPSIEHTLYTEQVRKIVTNDSGYTRALLDLNGVGSASGVTQNGRYYPYLNKSGSTFTSGWEKQTSPIPAISSGDAGKVLTVNAEETGAEWASPSGGSTTEHILYYNDRSTHRYNTPPSDAPTLPSGYEWEDYSSSGYYPVHDDGTAYTTDEIEGISIGDKIKTNQTESTSQTYPDYGTIVGRHYLIQNSQAGYSISCLLSFVLPSEDGSATAYQFGFTFYGNMSGGDAS